MYPGTISRHIVKMKNKDNDYTFIKNFLIFDLFLESIKIFKCYSNIFLQIFIAKVLFKCPQSNIF